MIRRFRYVGGLIGRENDMRLRSTVLIALALAVGATGCDANKGNAEKDDAKSSSAKAAGSSKSTASTTSTAAPGKTADAKPAASSATPAASSAAPEPTVTAEAKPVDSAAPAAGADGGKSAVPTTDEWNAVKKEITVSGSGKLNCETKQLREWIRVSCRDPNDSGGSPTGVRVTKGGGRGDDFVFTAPKVASLVFRFVDGVHLEAEFTWTDKKQTLIVDWPHGAPEPPAKGRFQ